MALECQKVWLGQANVLGIFCLPWLWEDLLICQKMVRIFKSSFVPVALTIQSIESKLWMKSMNSAIYAKWFQRISLVKVWSVISYHIVIKPLYLKRKHACVGKLFRLHWRHSRPIMIGRRCFSRGLMGHSKTTLHRW